MDNKSNYKYLLSDLAALKGVGSITKKLLKKKILTIFLIYFGNYPSLIQIVVYLQKLEI